MSQTEKTDFLSCFVPLDIYDCTASGSKPIILLSLVTASMLLHRYLSL